MSSIPLALPKTMLPSPEGATSAGVSSQWVKILPNNASQVVSSDATLANSITVPTQIVLGSQQLNFDIPTGAGPNVFCDTAKSTVSFRVRYQVSTAATTNYTGTIASLQSSAHSFINRMSTYVAGNLVDDVTNYDLALAEQVNWGFDVAQRDSQFHLGLRAEQDGASSQNNLQGHSIPAFTGTTLPLASSYYSYEIPFCNALLGTHNRSMCPVGKLSKTQVSLYTPQIAPVTIINETTATGAGAVVRITIDQIAINLFYITLDEPSMRLLQPKGEHYMAGTTYRVGSGTIAASTSGSTSVQIPIRVKSCRSLASRFSESVVSLSGSVNGIFDSKMPLCSTLNYFIASQKRIPPNPHNTVIAPATVYARALMANYDAAYDSWKSRSGLVSNLYYNYTATGSAPTAANSDRLVFDAGSDSVVVSLSAFSFAEDLRSASSANFLSGQDLTMSNSFLELNIANAPTNSLYVSFIAKADIIFVVLPDGSVESRV
jgi:hypothetical protein